MKRSVLTTKDLTIGYSGSKRKKEQNIQKELNVSLYSGELTCLLGANGVGKSTLFRTLSNMQSPLGGEVILFDKHIKEYSEPELSTILGLVLTDKTSIGGFTVREVVGLGRYPYTGFFGRLSAEDKAIVDKAMEEVSISHKSDNYLAELSDGEKQKVMIAKTLAQQCPLIILDEPTAFLDVTNKFEIMMLLHRLATEQNKTVLLSTHDIELALTLADRLWVMAKDKPLKTGITEDVVMSGIINEYIGNKNLFFDKKTGRFISDKNKDKIISLSAASDVGYCWSKNFFERRGYSIASDRENLFLVVDIIEPFEIIVTYNNENYAFCSYESLSTFLDQIDT